MNAFCSGLAVAVLCLMSSSSAASEAAQPPAALPNPDFTEGDQAPAGWTLSGGTGRWVDRSALEVTGTGEGSNHWRAECRFEPGGLYRFAMRARQVEGGGCVIAGPAFANRDHQLSDKWQSYDFAFRVPDGVERSYVRLGQWEARGAAQFDSARVTPVLPVHSSFGDVLLGEGESLHAGRYTFIGTFGGRGGNYHRTLDRATATFNSNRWMFGSGSELVYRFGLPGVAFRTGEVSFSVNYHVRGACVVEASRDGQSWLPLASLDRVGTADAALPEGLLPADSLLLRLRAGEGPATFQVDRVELSAEVDSTAEATGQTWFAQVTKPSLDLFAERLVLEHLGATGEPSLLVMARQTGASDVGATLEAAVIDAHLDYHALPLAKAQLDGGRPAGFHVRLTRMTPGDEGVTLRLGAPGLEPLEMFVDLHLSDFYRTDYGARIAGADGSGSGTAVWWCDATRKIPRGRGVPEATSPAAVMSAARNDREAVQIVVRPERELKGLMAAASPLRGPGGAVIPAENVSVLRVYYHFVHTPTDSTGVRDFWPDALPPLDAALDVLAGQNQPLWVRVHVPADAAPGDYEGEIALRAEGFSARVPLRLHVWNFALPERNRLETAFGLRPATIFRYHQLTSDEDKRRVLDMYLQSFAEQRISPYSPAPLDPIRVKFLPEADPPRAELDFRAFDPAMARALEKYRFTSFMVQLQGMGGGSFHARVDPSIGRFGEDTPEYQAMIASYLGQLDAHLRERGWLDKAYTYWFDEPDPKDYEFVRRGMERIQRHAPGLRTMLTEQPEPELAGPVDIWCPVSPHYDHEVAQARRAEGDKFWWYLCCFPKEPYCTLFIDHPATELRVWLWQTWQRRIDGILVWSADYWTSSSAFPDPEKPQNPYDDPMGYVSGYSTPPGMKRFWGNGDGRFLYPPLEAAVPGASGAGPVLKPPVSSIRWEMLREGIEDHEMLVMLRDWIEKRRAALGADELARCESRLDVPPEITADMTTFTTDPAPIYARRAEVAEAIERLVAGEKAGQAER